MRTSNSSMTASNRLQHVADTGILALFGGLGIALLAALAAAAPALASEGPKGPRYSIEVTEGETTLPELQQVAATSASVEPSAPLALSIIRNGTVVYRDVSGGGGAWLSEVPQVGDTVTLESPVKTVVGAVVYDGLPSIDASVCVGSTNFSGANSPGYTVEGSRATWAPTYNSSGRVNGVRRTSFSQAQVKSLTGTTYGGSFLAPLALGDTVGAVESLKTPLAGEATFTYTSEFERPVGGCPSPPPPPPPPPPAPALSGSILKLVGTTIHKFLRLGWSDQVSINQAGTVTQDLYLDSGRLPAYATSHKRRRKLPPPALLLARGAATAKVAGVVQVRLQLTQRGRRKLKTVGRARGVLITTLTTPSGQKLSLGRRIVSLRR
jgi:hypothetical protein